MARNEQTPINQTILTDEPISMRQTKFGFVNPTEPIEKEGFIGAFRGGVYRDLRPERLHIREKDQEVEIFGFQTLKGEGAEIKLHQEKTQTELTYLLQGNMEMWVIDIFEEPIIYRMEGEIPPEANLSQANFTMLETGVLEVGLGAKRYTIKPAVTPKGTFHSTEPKGDCVYLAVKVSE